MCSLEGNGLKTGVNEDLNKAILSVTSGEKSIRQAAKHYGIPKSTLFDKVKGNIPKKLRNGPVGTITQEEESSIVDWVINCSKRGQPRTPTDIRFAVKSIIDQFPRDNPFKNNLPSHNWYKRFVQRNPRIKPRKPEALSSSSANVTEADLKGWWANINQYLEENRLIHIMKHPERIANCDESMFEFNAKPGKVLVEKDSKNSYMAQISGNKTGCTVLHTVLADGSYLEPFLVFPYKRIPDNVKSAVSALEGIEYNYNPSGWMSEDNFIYYVEHVFVKGMKKRNAVFPVIIFLDNHSSHVSLKISKLCDELGVILITLYPNSTYISQPLDCAVFRGIKAHWSNLLIKKRGENGNFKVNMVNFPELLLELLKTAHNSEAVKNGFKCCGIFEWNCNNIDFSKLLNYFSPENNDDLFEHETSSTVQSECVGPKPPSPSTVLYEYDCPKPTSPSTVQFDPVCQKSPIIEFIDLMENSTSSYDELRVQTTLIEQNTFNIENFEIFSDNAGTSSRLDFIHKSGWPVNSINPINELSNASSFEFNDTQNTLLQDEPLDLSVDCSSKKHLVSSNQSSSLTLTPPQVPGTSNFDKSTVYNDLKEIYGVAKFKQFSNDQYTPEDMNEDILMRIIHRYRPITQPKDVLSLPPATKRLGVKNTRKQPFVISSNDFRQFRSKNNGRGVKNRNGKGKRILWNLSLGGVVARNTKASLAFTYQQRM
uniref:CSON001214 protein n=1 Tax=Culicoides sonorensis TaxID=179676 RepID=A0A336MIV7_CULSO